MAHPVSRRSVTVNETCFVIAPMERAIYAQLFLRDTLRFDNCRYDPFNFAGCVVANA